MEINDGTGQVGIFAPIGQEFFLFFVERGHLIFPGECFRARLQHDGDIGFLNVGGQPAISGIY